MPIQAGDIKLLKSAVMQDVPEGGGRPTAEAIVDGSSNAVFPDISEVDRAGGRVNMRKVFAAIRTADTDSYFGANVIVAEPYQDPRVSVTLFATGDTFDRREDAASRLESYLAKGPSFTGQLFGDHLAGQMSVTVLLRPELAPPVIGGTLVLSKATGLPSQVEQFIRVTDVTVTERQFTDGSGDFRRNQVVLGISDQLQHDFPGFDAIRMDSAINYTGRTKLFDTIVADAARYYGVVPLESAAGIGDFSVQTEGIYTQLVPSTRVEVGIADARMNQQSATLVKAGEAYSRNVSMVFDTGNSMFIGGGILPGSLTVARGGVTITDKGGLLISAVGDQVGLVDYANGVLTLATSVWGASAGTHAVSYTPAATPTMVGESLAVAVTAESQRLNYVVTLDPPPARGSLQVSYRALGQWYVLTEDGSGGVRGADSSFGAGSLNYQTGTVSVTLGALPDVGSAVIYSFVAAAVVRPIQSLPLAGPSLPRRLGKPVSLGKAIKPGTLSLTWNDGAARTASDAGGVLTGDATGTVNYAEGVIDFRPNTLPAKDTAVTAAITEAVQAKTALATLVDGGSAWTGSLPAPLKAGSVELSVIAQYTLPAESVYGGLDRGAPTTVCVRLFDNGSGGLLIANIDRNDPIGTVNYATGALSIPKVFGGYKVDAPKLSVSPIAVGPGRGVVWKEGYKIQELDLTLLNGPGSLSVSMPAWAWWGGPQANAVEARYAGNDGSGSTHPFTLDTLFLPANPNGFGATIGYALDVTGFELGGSRYSLRSTDGVWLRDLSPSTGVGSAAGSRAVIGGQAGVLIGSWPAGASSAPSAITGATQPDLGGDVLSVDQVTFRTAVAPLVTAGFQVAANFSRSGASITATAASNGHVISGSAVVGELPGSPGVFGIVDYEMGLVTLNFGRRVPVSMAGADYVVDLSSLGLPGVQYVEIIPVKADTLRYNATGYSYLPLSPALLGLNPVRLPPDGRVPIFRPGAFAVLGHRGEVVANVANGQTVTCARTRLSRVRVIGANGTVINTGYTADLDAGLVNFTNVAGYAQPVTIEHRVEDMMMVRDAQISGLVSFTRPVTHAYPAGSYLSSALVAGDVFARVSTVFDQASWTSAWSNDQIGSAATGTFDDVGAPIVVKNLGALTERWAVIFTSNTAFNVVGEHVGVIASGNTGSDCAPLNPGAGQPYFSIPSAGWGAGWATGNVLRFNTVGAQVPVWAVRTILAGPETVNDDDFTLLVRGDVDRP